MAVLQPDYKTPFRSLKDAVARLLPYHIFEYPDEDMKGNNQTSDLDGMYLYWLKKNGCAY
jgi:hypothetical protein